MKTGNLGRSELPDREEEEDSDSSILDNGSRLWTCLFCLGFEEVEDYWKWMRAFFRGREGSAQRNGEDGKRPEQAENISG